jgi:hypothetical protein
MDLTRRLRGKRIAHVTTNGHVLRITTEDNCDIEIAWLGDNGAILKGKPSVFSHGPRLIAKGISELIHFPALRAKGEA